MIIADTLNFSSKHASPLFFKNFNKHESAGEQDMNCCNLKKQRKTLKSWPVISFQLLGDIFKWFLKLNEISNY